MASGPTARRASFLIAAAVFVTLAGLGLSQLLKDGSFWLDEASLALSLLRLEPLESFGPLIGGQSFPRLYLLAVYGLVGIFGYETMVVRLLPQVFFLAATFAWLRLLLERFRDEPVWIALAGLLLAVPGTWLLYGAMFKSYSLDVFVSTIPFLLRDEFYDDVLERGARPWRLLALTSLGAVSYPFAMVLLARLSGWWLQRAVARRPSVAPRSVAFGLAGMAGFGALLWTTDLRHTSELGDALRRYWGACLVGGDTGTLALLDRFVFGWFDARADFSRTVVAGVPLALLEVGFGAGLVRVGLALAPGRPLAAPARWGSRSLGYAVLLLGLPLASWLFGYPICAGRLTLFALLPIVVLMLEGIDLAAVLLRRVPGGAWGGLLAGLALALAILPSSYENLARIAKSPPPEDLRPLLLRASERSDLPILTTTCTRRQIETLPEGVPAEVLYVQQGGGIAIAVREPPEAWFLFVPAPLCAGGVSKVFQTTVLREPHHGDAERARLFHIRFGRR